MWRRLRKTPANDSRTGLSVDGSRIAFARVQQSEDGGLQVAASAVDTQADDGSWAQRLATKVDGFDAGRSQLTSVLPDGSYQLLLVDLPKLPADEIKSAIRWQIKDLLDFPIDETTIQIFDMPSPSSTDQKSMAYVVATQRSSVQEHIDLLQGAGLTLDVINIPELCTRNIATLLPQDADGVAFLHIEEDHGILTITRQGVLYLIRRIEKGRSLIRSAASDDFSRAELASTFVLEIQRSLDYYESHFDRRPLRELVVSPGSDIGGLADSLNEQLGLNVSRLDLGQMFDMRSAVSAEEQGDCLLAIGAALRSESLAA